MADKYHKNSETYAAHAEIAVRNGKTELAKKLYRLSAENETYSLILLDKNKQRDYGVAVTSAAALWLKAGKVEFVEMVVFIHLRDKRLPGWAVEQLREILVEAWKQEKPVYNH